MRKSLPLRWVVACLGILPVLAEHGVTGRLAYSRNGEVFVQDLSESTARSLGAGRWPRWNQDGQRLLAWNGDHFVLLDADIGARHRVPGTFPAPESEAFFDFHPNGKEVVAVHPAEGIVALRLDTGDRRPFFPQTHAYTGELGISADGTRLAARGRPSPRGRGTNHLYAMDVNTGESREYLRPACSAGVSPDGRWLMNNGDQGNQTHARMNVRRWDDSEVRVLRTDLVDRRIQWDNQHWSNHPRVIATEITGGEMNRAEAGLILLPEGRVYRLTRVGNVEYPDLWVKSVPDSVAVPGEPPPLRVPEIAVDPGLKRELSAELVQTVTLPGNLDYAAALVVYLYRDGEGNSLHVVHRALHDHKPVADTVGRRAGDHHTLSLVPFVSRAELQTLFVLDPHEDLDAIRWWALEKE